MRPREDLERFGVTEESIAARRPSASYDDLLRFEAARALDLFRRAEPVKDLVDRECRFGVTMMGGIYAEVAALVLACPSATLAHRLALSKGAKLAAVLRRLFRMRFVLGTPPV